MAGTGGGGSPARSPKTGSFPPWTLRPATPASPPRPADGYRAHLAADPETGIITDEKLTRAAGQENSDPAVAEEFLAAGAAGAGAGATPGASSGSGGDNGGGGDPLAWYGDSAYGTGDLRDAICDGRRTRR